MRCTVCTCEFSLENIILPLTFSIFSTFDEANNPYLFNATPLTSTHNYRGAVHYRVDTDIIILCNEGPYNVTGFSTTWDVENNTNGVETGAENCCPVRKVL